MKKYLTVVARLTSLSSLAIMLFSTFAQAEPIKFARPLRSLPPVERNADETKGTCVSLLAAVQTTGANLAEDAKACLTPLLSSFPTPYATKYYLCLKAVTAGKDPSECPAQLKDAMATLNCHRDFIKDCEAAAHESNEDRCKERCGEFANEADRSLCVDLCSDKDINKEIMKDKKP